MVRSALPLGWLEQGAERFEEGDVVAFQRILLILLATEYWCRAIPQAEFLSAEYWAVTYGATAAAITGLLGGRIGFSIRRVVFLALGVAHTTTIWSEFPATGNHAYLEAIFCFACAFLRVDEGNERRLLVAFVRWMIVVVFFYAGLQKLVHGYYFHGQYLAFSAWIETFRPVLAVLLPEGELTRVAQYGNEVGAGPFLVVGSPLFVVVSNLTWIGELAAAVLLLLPRTRVLGLLVAVAMIVVIEVAAREAFFGALFVLGILFHGPRPVQRAALPVAVAFCGALLAVRFGLLPDVSFY